MTGRGTERLTQSSSAVSGWAMVTIAGMWDNEVVKEFKYGHIKRGVRLSDSSWWGHCYVDSGGGGKGGVEGRQDWRYIYRKEVKSWELRYQIGTRGHRLSQSDRRRVESSRQEDIWRDLGKRALIAIR